MTIALSYVFEDGIVMLSDSRAVWNNAIPEDALQKIIFLTSKILIGYACEDLSIVNDILNNLKNKLSKDNRFNNPFLLSSYLSRISKYYYKKSKEFSFIVSGISENNVTESYILEYPFFENRKIEKSFKVIGTGKIILDYLQKNKLDLEDKSLNLKERADKLFIGIAGALDRVKIDSVGGFFQIFLITSRGISPMEHGYTNINPLGNGESKKIEWKGDGWIQKDFKKEAEISVLKPEQLISEGVKNIKFHDYFIADKKSKPKWYLSHFIICNLVNIGIGYTEFIDVISQIGFFKYPIKIQALVAIRFWGDAGKYNVLLKLKKNDTETILYKDLIESKTLPYETDLINKISLNINSPGLAFLEFYVENNLIGRNVLFFGKTINIQLCGGNIDSFTKSSIELLKENNRSCRDKEIEENGKIFFNYYSICEQAEINNKIIFKNQFFAAFWENFPLMIKTSIACGIRMSKGKHNINICLIDAVNGKKQEVLNDKTEASSSCLTVQHLFKNITFKLEKPSLYYINLYIDDKLVCNKILSAEKSNTRFSINPLFPSQIEQVKRGELLLLLNRPFTEKIQF